MISGLERWGQKVEFATGQVTVQMAAGCFAVAEATKLEYEKSRRSANVNLYGVVMLFAKFVATLKKNMFATDKIPKTLLIQYHWT